jgi:hypothetical protein
VSTDRWRGILESLRNSFEGIAIRSRGVFHTMVEHQQVEAVADDEGIEPPGWKRFAEAQDNGVLSIGGLPGDPPKLRALTAEEAAAAPAPTENDKYIRDKRGVPHAIRVPSVIRMGFMSGNRESVTQFRILAEAAGRVFRGLPPDVLSMFPATLAEIPRKQWMVDRRYVFGEVTGPRPGWMGQGWAGGMLQYEKGVIFDSPEVGAGSRDGAEMWLFVLHRLGWLGNSNSLVLAHRYFWSKNTTVGYELLHNEARVQLGDPFAGVAEKMPKHRFFSVFGKSQDEPTDVCWVSKWALDELLALAAPAVQTSDRMISQLRLVEEAETRKAKGVELERLMQVLFSSVEGFRVRDTNVRTQTEEIDLVLDNKCLHHPWDRESPILLVECKNWSKPSGKNDIVVFQTKVKNRRGRCTVGFFIAWKGFARTVERELLRSSQDNSMLVLLTGAQIKSAIQSGAFTQLLDSAWYDALKI